ncbi:MAG: hypothetical protein KJZ81_18095 [Burkholderiaceae bacterium]|nr:hypothetical protein [Burkholderiaceae bacterium]
MSAMKSLRIAICGCGTHAATEDRQRQHTGPLESAATADPVSLPSLGAPAVVPAGGAVFLSGGSVIVFMAISGRDLRLAGGARATAMTPPSPPRREV